MGCAPHTPTQSFFREYPTPPRAFNLPSHNHIHIAKNLFFIRDEQYKNLGDNTILAREMFSSGCRPRLKNARA